MAERRTRAALAAFAVVSLGGLATIGYRAIRPRLLDFGSTFEERGRSLPGDELLPHADLVATRAITIAATPRDVFPWLVQIGTGRAGAYSYDWLDRFIGLDMYSSREIIPELQDLGVGDVIPVANDGTGLRVRRLEAPHVLATRTDDDTWAWTWVLEPTDGGTRLLSRTRMDTRRMPALQRVATDLFIIPASWLMERKMLDGIRARAEGRG